MLVMESLGMTAGHPQEPSHRLFGNLDEARRRADPTPFVQVVKNGRCFGLRNPGIDKCRPASL